MTKSAVDTHRLMYRNARIRALDLSDRTSQIDFYNITEADPDGDNIGKIVYTDPNGYLFYGNNTQSVSCLAVKQSAIIQVDLHDTDAWNIEWIVEVDADSQYVTIAQIGKVYDSDGNLLWNPVGNNWQIPDWVRRDEIAQGEWAEGELVLKNDTDSLVINKWTHSIIVRKKAPMSLTFEEGSGRYGQVITIINTDISGSEHEFTDGSSGDTVTIGYNQMCFAIHSGSRWLFSPVITRAFGNKQLEVSYRSASVSDPSIGTLLFFISGDIEGDITITDTVNTSQWMNILVIYNGSVTPAAGSKTLNITINDGHIFTLTKNHDGSNIPAYTTLFSGAYRRLFYKAQSPDDTYHVHVDKETYIGWYTL